MTIRLVRLEFSGWETMNAPLNLLFDFTAADLGQRNFKRSAILKFGMGARQKPYCHANSAGRLATDATR